MPKRASSVGSVVTISDVARECGVSIATVSRALHSPDMVRPDTRRRIQRVIQQTGYVYNSLAGELARKKNSLIGIITPNTDDQSFHAVLRELQASAVKKGFDVILGNSCYDFRTESRLLQRLRERRISAIGLVGFCQGQEEQLRIIQNSGTPCLILWDKVDDPGLNYIGFDNQEAVCSAVSYLIGLGHKRIAFMVGPHRKIHSAHVRVKGYMQAFAQADLPHDERWIVPVDASPDLEAGRSRMLKLMALDPRPTAVLAAGDALALGCIMGAAQLDLRVPADVSVMGMDDAPFAANALPTLTTVNIPNKRIGTLAAKFFTQVVETGEAPKCRECLPTTIVERESCVPPCS